MDDKTKARSYIVSFENYWNENTTLRNQIIEETASEKEALAKRQKKPKGLQRSPKSAEGYIPFSVDVAEKKVIPYRIIEVSGGKKSEVSVEEEQKENSETVFYTRDQIKVFLNNINIVKNKSTAFGNTNADYFCSITDLKKSPLRLTNNYKKNLFTEKKDLIRKIVTDNNLNPNIPPFEDILDFLLDSKEIEINFNLSIWEKEKFFFLEEPEEVSNLPDYQRKGVFSSSDKFVFFNWGSNQSKIENNDFILMKILFEHFGKDDFHKKFPNKKSLQKYIKEKYSSSILKNSFDEFKKQANFFWYNKSISEKKEFLFKHWYSPGVKRNEMFTGREIYGEPEIDKLKTEDFLNGVFALTSSGEIVYIDIFKEFCFGYQMKQSEITGKASESYLNFLVIAVEQNFLDQETKSIVFRPGAYSYNENEKPEERFMSLKERFPRVHLVKNLNEKDGRLIIGNTDYYTETEIAYANYDNIFKTCIGSEYLDDQKIDNIKLCLPCLNLEKKFPIFTFFEKMTKNDYIELSGLEEKCITRDLIAVDDIVALFEFDSKELGGAEEKERITRKRAEQFKIMFGG